MSMEVPGDKVHQHPSANLNALIDAFVKETYPNAAGSVYLGMVPLTVQSTHADTETVVLTNVRRDSVLMALMVAEGMASEADPMREVWGKEVVPGESQKNESQQNQLVVLVDELARDVYDELIGGVIVVLIPGSEGLEIIVLTSLIQQAAEQAITAGLRAVRAVDPVAALMH